MSLESSMIRQGDQGFEKAVMATLFNKQEPGRRPRAIIQPKTVEDIKKTIKYAQKNNLKISVCSGGHSWSANHLRNDSILIDMSNFNQYELDANRLFAKAGPAVGGSDLLIELYKHGLFFPAGHCKGVCIGGYLLQGGFAWNGRKLGMACESVLGIDIVTAEGELVHASATENEDLYWAARGSGGGFFGVVVCFHLRLYPLPKYRGMILHTFGMKHLEEVFNWAYEVGPSIPPAVEFQMITSRKTMQYLSPGIEVFAPFFADSKDELDAAMAFMKNSPVKKKAYFKTPFFDPGIKMLYRFAMVHYPENHHWGVDNMWTNANIQTLMPFIKDIAASLPPAPAHMLWLNWQPPERKTPMAFSKEDKIYIALYGFGNQQRIP
jgi:FAD/FMN-containing dehydrogenase